ncbi:MAG TPA: FkbM family methyltransferase [Stellaceae bacterium]|nr:FkbM family methyltransferase [Stellaceae bacterium]
MVRSDTFRHHLGAFDANLEPRFLRAVSLLRNASNEEAAFVRDLVNVEDQDCALWVLHETRQKRDGYFVEFGATDGISLSNTHLLEQEFGWRGILAEPNPDWHPALPQNRNAAIDLRCVFATSGAHVPFAVTRYASLATIAEFVACDAHARARQDHRLIEVETISLNDLLTAHEAPHDIDFISIDTEGSEYEILSAFDFDRWNVLLFSVEHNRTDREGKIDALMSRHGYQRRFAGYPTLDAWYRRVQ